MPGFIDTYLINYLIYLKEDLQLAKTCKTTKDTVLKFIRDKTIFSESLTHFFTSKEPPFIISSDDEPPQVTVLKKLLNAIDNVERTLRDFEEINIDPDQYSAVLVLNVGIKARTALHDIYSALQLINTSSQDIQAVISPYIQKIVPQLAAAGYALKSISEQATEKVGLVQDEAMGMLLSSPSSQSEMLGGLSQFIYQIPHLFEELQRLITTEPLTNPSVTSSLEYQKKMQKKAMKMQKHFEKFSSKSGALAIPSYLSIVKKLISHSTALISTAAPLTEQAYLEAVKKLQEMKHKIIPQLISELEMLEENMGLKTGTLTTPALVQMDAYYKQLATQVNNIAAIHGVLDKKLIRLIWSDEKAKISGEKMSSALDLEVLIDEGFVEQRRVDQINRLHEAQFDVKHSYVIEAAANRFFKKISAYNQVTYFGRLKGSLTNISQSEQEALIAEYKQFQPYLAALHPEVDALIVDVLTPRQEGSSFFSRAWKQIAVVVGGNPFAKIVETKESVISSISKSRAQAKFRKVQIANTIAHTEKTTDEALKTNVQASVLAEQKLIPEDASAQSASFFHQKWLALSEEIRKIEEAEQGVRDFFDALRKFYSQDYQTFASLGEEDRESLRRFYKKFQDQLVLIGKEPNYFLQMIDSENSSFEDIIALESIFWESLSLLETARNNAFSQEMDAREREASTTPLVKRGAELEIRTLFGQIRAQNLSKSLGDFFEKTLEPGLKNNLSDFVWRQLSTDDGKRLDVKKIPYTSFHKDSPEVAFYKQLINSLYYTKLGLEKLETLESYGDPNYMFYRSQFLKANLDALVFNINYGKYYLQQLADNPALKIIMKEGMYLLEPLKDMPIIGEYLKAERAPPPVQKSVIEAWHEQQEVVRKARSSKPKHEPKAVQESKKPESKEQEFKEEAVAASEETILQIVARNLYEIPLKMQKKFGGHGLPEPSQEELNANIQGFVDELSGLSIGPESLKKILNASGKLQAQLSDVGKVSLSQLKEIRSEFDAILMETFDSVEFNLGLKPGSYAGRIHEKFESFFNALIANLPLKNHEKWDILMNATGIQARLVKERKRLRHWEGDDTADKVQNSLFGPGHDAFFTWFNLVSQVPKDIYQFSQEEAIRLSFEAEPYYALIQADLVKHDPKFTKDFISRADSPFLRAVAMDAVFEALKKLTPANPFDDLINLYLEDDFEKKDNQEKFLNIYAKLQPYLEKVDYKYNLTFFLRDLRTPEDFKQAAEKIIQDEGKLQELITGLRNAKQLKMNLSLERINYLEEIHKNLKGRIKDVKGQIFEEYINTNVKPILEKELGPAAPIFLKRIMKDCEPIKAAIIKDVSIRRIQHEIEDRFKPFFNSMVKKEKHAMPFQFYKEINAEFQVKKSLLEEEEKKPAGNPYRKEKISFLKQSCTAIINNLKPEGMSEEERTDLENINAKMKDKNILAHYDIMINLYDTLRKMQVHVGQEKSSPLKEQRLLHINKMLLMLSSQTEEPFMRVAQVKAYAVSETSIFTKKSKTLSALHQELILPISPARKKSLKQSPQAVKEEHQASSIEPKP